MTGHLKVEDGQIVSMDYQLTVEGRVIDSSAQDGPFEYLQGAGTIVPGLERAMRGMAVGESKDVFLDPADGYGELNAEAFMDVPRGQFPGDILLKVGTELQVQESSGRSLFARIDQVGEETIRLDFNHPLAGKELQFNVKVVGLRPATDEEREHGHVHDGHTH